MKKKYLLIIPLIILIGVFIVAAVNNKKKYIQYDDNTFLAVIVNDVEMTSLPSKGDYNVDITCTNATAKWDYDGWKAIISNMTAQVKCSLVFTSATSPNLATHIMGLGTGQGVWNEPATDYRYEGKNPNNWISFNGEKWRIIGVFGNNSHGKTGNLVKIIRSEALSGYIWNKTSNNDWTTSSLQTLLNTNYYNSVDESTLTNCYGYSTTTPGRCNFVGEGIKTIYRGMIENATWKLGGIGTIGTVAAAYSDERGTVTYSSRPTTGASYIGLLYPSDYGYSVLASSCARSVLMSAYNTAACAGQSWLYESGYEWMLTPNSGNNNLWSTNYTGNVVAGGVTSGFSVRPALYLKANAKKVAGTGTYADPYIITL